MKKKKLTDLVFKFSSYISRCILTFVILTFLQMSFLHFKMYIEAYLCGYKRDLNDLEGLQKQAGKAANSC